MLNNFSLGLVLVVAIIMLGFADKAEAGVCWISRKENGKCNEIYSKNISKEECCRNQEFGYTEKDLSDIEIFFANAIGEGAVCISCLDSCDIDKCGPGKRCVIRKGRPKCICAPLCKSSKEKKSMNVPGRVIDFNRNEKLADFNFGIFPGREKVLHNINKEKTEFRWKRETDNRKRLLHNEDTEKSRFRERKRSQRKSNLSKRRKHSTTVIPPNSDDVEDISTSLIDKLPSSSKSDRIIIAAEGIPRDILDNLENSVKRKKNLNISSKDFAIVQSSTALDRHNHLHHNRHPYKKHRKSKEKQNTTISHRQHIHQSNSMVIPLDEKIRSGYFNHGFPYLTDTTQIAHGRYYNPVCGTDAKTYKTECQLKKRACRRDSTTLTVAYRGHCQVSCKSVRCLNNLTCVEDQYGIPHCITCTITCPQDDISSVIDPTKAVCGVDGLTYRSICEINRLICTTGRSVAVAYYGPCQDAANCNNIQCGEKKMCLNDLVTNKPRCMSCSFKCARKRRPQGQRYQDEKICGNNNHTYNSWCQMRRDSCNTGFYIDVNHTGACHKDSVSIVPVFT